MRTSILATLFFFSLVPMTLAGVDLNCGTGTPDPTGSYCVSTTGVNTSGSQTTGVNTGSGISLINPLKGVNCANGNGNCLAAFLNSILDFVIQIGTILIVLMVVFVGYKFVVAQGAPAKIEEARKMLLWTLVGALILLGAKAISLGIVATVQALGG